MTEPDSMPDPDSDEEDKPDRKDSLDVHEEGYNDFILLAKC